MTIEEHATRLETALRQLVRVDRRQWTSPEEKDALVHTLKAQVRVADQVLQHPSTPETASARGKLIVQVEMARASVKSFEEKGTLV